MALDARGQLTDSRLVADIELHRDRVKLVGLPTQSPLTI
jgi:hypothetical protein